MRDAGLMYGNIIYDKSPVVMAMLIRMMGKEAFQKGIQEYLKTYAYGNATWEGLISILDTYTDEDLKSWSHVWVHEKGMPEISAEIKCDSLFVSQADPFGRGLCWPQEIKYMILSENSADVISITCATNSNCIGTKLQTPRQGKTVVIPNVDGAAYGFFRVKDEQEESITSSDGFIQELSQLSGLPLWLTTARADIAYQLDDAFPLTLQSKIFDLPSQKPQNRPLWG